MDIESTPLRGVQRNEGGKKEDPAKIFAFDIEAGSVSTPTILTTIIRISGVVVKSDSKFTRHPDKFFWWWDIRWKSRFDR